MEKLVEVKNLKKYFTIRKKSLLNKQAVYLKAVDDVSFYINEGETLGVVGESGCGKSTLARTMIKLYEPTDGSVLINGKDIYSLNNHQLTLERQNFQIIFQDPYASLNPRMTIGDIVAEPMVILKNRGHLNYTRREIKDRVKSLLEIVGLSGKFINRYPHEFSGGQRQRIGVARSLALNPRLILCDEPVSALDVSIQSQIINLLVRLQDEFNLTYMFISHDLSVVKHISDRIAVMYLGKIVEIADSKKIYYQCLHPYSKALLSAIPIPNPDREKQRQRIILEGDVPSPDKEFFGCRFKDRCFLKTSICETEEPVLEDKGDRHYSACHHYNKVQGFSDGLVSK
jgi:oligopeptide transport system ATP-binding protein